MINTLKELWPQLPDKEKREIANFVAKQMQPKTTDTARELLQELNDLLGTRYRPVTANLSLIQARLAEGNTREDISAVIARMCRMWANDPKMSQYLRPKTLFSATNFNNYVGQIGMEVPRGTNQQTSGQRKLSVAERATEARKQWERENPDA